MVYALLSLRHFGLVAAYVSHLEHGSTASRGAGQEAGAQRMGTVLRLVPEKTAATSEARIAIDLRECPMVVEELAHVPPSRRTGPLIVDERTGLPYNHRTLRSAWRRDCGRDTADDLEPRFARRRSDGGARSRRIDGRRRQVSGTY
jgi:hypothetical protein